MRGTPRRRPGSTPICGVVALTCLLGLATGRVATSAMRYESAAPAPNTSFPLIWAQSLALTARQDVPNRLSKPTRDTSERAVWTQRCATTSPDRGCQPITPVVTATCDEFWLARARGLSVQSAMDANDLLAIGARCASIKAVGTARDATRSAVRSFRLSNGAMDVLPATLGLAVTPRDSVRLWAAGSRGVSLRQIVTGATTAVEHYEPADTVLTILGDHEQHSLEVLARGDFTADGWDDLLIHAVARARGGSFTTNEVYVLTRRVNHGRLSVVRRIW